MANFNDEKSPAVLNFFDMSSEVCRFYMGNVSWVSLALSGDRFYQTNCLQVDSVGVCYL